MKRRIAREKRIVVASALLLAGAFLAGCEVAGEPGPELEDEFIVGGVRDLGDPAVVAFVAVDGQGQIRLVCTGTLIEPSVILTAAHCIDPATNGLEPGSFTMKAYFGSDLTETDPLFIEERFADQIFVPPDWDANTFANDIALAHLVEPSTVKPLPINTAAVEPFLGDAVRLVGFGRVGGRPDQDGVGIKRQTTTVLSQVEETQIAFIDSDHNTCNGDSGGPAFMTIDGVEVVVGVSSFNDEFCEEFGVDTRVDVFVADFIEPIIASF